MADVSWPKMQPVVAALDESSAVVHTYALRALVRLPLGPDTWLIFRRKPVPLFCTSPKGDTLAKQTVHSIPYRGIIDAAIFIALPDVRSSLYLLQVEDEEVRKTTTNALTLPDLDTVFVAGLRGLQKIGG